MSNIKQYGEFVITVIHNKRLKHSYLRIKENKTLEVRTPILTQGFVEAFIEEKRDWIYKQFQKIDATLYLGEQKHTLEDIQKRLFYYAELMNLNFSILKFRKMKSRWGSCSSKRVITLNKELMRVDLELIDYVIVHELAHLRHMNHSKDFHALVASYLPDAKERRAKLKKISLSRI